MNGVADRACRGARLPAGDPADRQHGARSTCCSRGERKTVERRAGARAGGAAATEVSIGGRSPFAGAKVADCRRGSPSGSGSTRDARASRWSTSSRTRRPPQLRLPAARHRARGQWRGDHLAEKLKQVAERRTRAGGASRVERDGRLHPPDAALLMADLFEADRPAAPQPAPRPLADRLRPTALAEVVGQEHLTGPDGALTRHDRRRLARLDDLLGAARHRQDHGGAAAGRRDRSRLRADLGDLLRRRRSQEGVRGGAAAPRQRAGRRCCSSTRSTASTAPSRIPSCR